ncbi:MAG: Gfo/Idh/MocA family oxidoreductase [Cytophagales bacterium]|nr:Gfo/Idh/MocA family oxidoreductase [Armatimonadota bacterium]
MHTLRTLETVRWGILGCGDVAEKKSGPALYRADHSELTAVMRRDRAKAEDFARRHGAKRAYDRVEDLLADREVNAVYIATPPHRHCEQTLLAAQAGKHVLVEKPMALNASECDRMIAACHEAGVLLHVAYYRRFYPKFLHAKEVLDRGAIGQVLGARVQVCARSENGGWRSDQMISGGGHLVDMGSHRLDMILCLLGDFAEVSGFAENLPGGQNVENDTAFALRMASGALVSAGFHYRAFPPRDVLEIYGSEGTLTFDPFDGETFLVRTQEASRREEALSFPTPSPVHLPFVQALVNRYRGEPSGPHVSGEEGVKTTRILDAVLRAFRTRQETDSR